MFPKCRASEDKKTTHHFPGGHCACTLPKAITTLTLKSSTTFTN